MDTFKTLRIVHPGFALEEYEQPPMLEPEFAERVTTFLMWLNCGLAILNEANCRASFSEAFRALESSFSFFGRET